MIRVCNDAYLFKGGLSLEQQERLVSLYKDSIKDLYIPILKSGYKMSLKMMSFGHHWSAIDYNYHLTRTDADNEPVKAMPDYISEWALPFSLTCFPLEKSEWDVCILNHYSLNSKLGMHSDNSEISKSPIVSYSIGASCIFKFGGVNRSDHYLDVQLDSGDVFVFGGSSRMNYHGITEIKYIENSPFKEDLEGGRINFTLRKL